jgi:hypothetical protein
MEFFAKSASLQSFLQIPYWLPVTRYPQHRSKREVHFLSFLTELTSAECDPIRALIFNRQG